MKGLRLGLSLTGSAFTPAALFSASQAGAWYDPSDLSSMYQTTDTSTPAAVNSPVGRINDKSGNGHHLTQGTAASRPVLKQSGSVYWLEFDGVDDWLFTTFSGIAQPYDRISGVREITQVNGYLLTGGASFSPGLRREDLTGIKLYAGLGFDCLNNDLAANTTGLVTERYNGASSSLQVNSGTAVTGNPGADSGAGLSVGALYDGTLKANMRWHGSVMRSALSATELSNTKAYLTAKSGL